MFSPRAEFRTLEEFVDHLVERIKLKIEGTATKAHDDISDLRAWAEDEVSGLKNRVDQFDQRIKAIENNATDALQSVYDRLRRLERRVLDGTDTPSLAVAPTPVNTPPAIQEGDDGSGNSQASTATASE